MPDFSNVIVNKRFREVYRKLEADGVIKGKSDIGKFLGTYNHIINDVLNGRRCLTVEQITKLCDRYNISPNYMFGASSDMFEATGSSDTPTRSYAERLVGVRNNITLVPQKALAGYALNIGDENYLKELQRFSIPNLDGQLIAFEISGDSMMPNIANGDIVICEPIERDEPLRDNGLYVIVTDVVVAKRIQQVKTPGQQPRLQLISDNSATYKPYFVDLDEIRQIMKVKCRLTNYGII